MKENTKVKIVVEYSEKRMDKTSLAGLFYDIIEQNQKREENYETKENNCA